MKCRLLYLIGELPAGGAERQLYYLIKSMDRPLYQPQVVVWNFKETDTYVSKIRALGVPVHSCLDSSSRLRKLAALRRMVTRIGPEVLHSYSFYMNFAAFCATLGTKTITLGGVRSDFNWAIDDAGPFLGRLSARWPRKQVFNAFAVAEKTKHSKSTFIPKECFVVRNGLDLELFSALPFTRNGKSLILGVGSLLEVKRWDRLTSAAIALKQKGLDFAIRVVGDGPLHTSLERQVDDTKLADCVEFIGHSDNIPGKMAEATFLVHVSDKEGSPNVIIEAMACGRAVVATDVGDVSNLVEDGTTGFVVPSGDDAMLIERMATLITDRNLCCRMGKAGRAKVEREFGLDRLVRETFAAYRSAGWKDR